MLPVLEVCLPEITRAGPALRTAAGLARRAQALERRPGRGSSPPHKLQDAAMCRECYVGSTNFLKPCTLRVTLTMTLRPSADNSNATLAPTRTHTQRQTKDTESGVHGRAFAMARCNAGCPKDSEPNRASASQTSPSARPVANSISCRAGHLSPIKS